VRSTKRASRNGTSSERARAAMSPSITMKRSVPGGNRARVTSG
jgi:hypothetical protein